MTYVMPRDILLSLAGRVPDWLSPKINCIGEPDQLSYSMSCRAEKSTSTEGPMVEVTYRDFQ